MMAGRSEVQVSSRLDGDEGAVLVEFALILPFMVLLVLGVFEFGIAWRNTTVISSSLRTAVRTDVQAQNLPSADKDALLALMSSLGQGKNTEVKKVIIYKVFDANTNGAPPAACVAIAAPGFGPYGQATATSTCNVYGPEQLKSANLVATNFGTATSCSGEYDQNWCPKDRAVSLGGAGPDTVGIWVELTYTSVSHLLPKATKVTDFTTARIEPSATS